MVNDTCPATCPSTVYAGTWSLEGFAEEEKSFTIAISMLLVIIVAALVGTFVPIILDKKGIDPAIATGPFITTSNDIFGIFLFFFIAKLILNF